MWSLGGALDLSPNISIGAALNYWNGDDDLLQEYHIPPSSILDDDLTYTYRYLDSYSGWNVKLGLLIQPYKFLSLGGVIDFPTKFTIDQSLDTTVAIFGEIVEEGTLLSYYELTHPYSLGGGAALTFKYVTLAGDIYYTDWTQMKPKAKNVDNILYKENYHNVFRWHIGAEFVMPELSTKVRIGYYEDPIPFKTVYLEKDRRYFTLGAGFLIDQVMTLDIAWNHGFHEFRDDWDQMIKESYTKDKIFVSLAYRL